MPGLGPPMPSPHPISDATRTPWENAPLSNCPRGQSPGRTAAIQQQPPHGPGPQSPLAPMRNCGSTALPQGGRPASTHHPVRRCRRTSGAASAGGRPLHTPSNAVPPNRETHGSGAQQPTPVPRESCPRRRPTRVFSASRSARIRTCRYLPCNPNGHHQPIPWSNPEPSLIHGVWHTPSSRRRVPTTGTGTS